MFYTGAARYQLNNGNRTTREDGDDWEPVGENFAEFNNTFGGSVSYDAFQLSLQFDATSYVQQPVPAADATQNVRNLLASRYQDVFRLEFLSLSYSDRTFDVTLGDFYVTLGRGMLLSIRKVGDVGVDNKLRGGEVRARIGSFTAYAFGGFLNIRNYEVGQGFFFPESVVESNCSRTADWLAVCPDGIDVIGGARLEYRAGKYAKIGAHGAVIDTPDDLNNIEGPDDITGQLNRNDANLRGYGVTVELPRPVRWLNAYLEGVRLERDEPARSTTEPGQGVYGNVNLFLGRTTVLIEGKAYDNLFNVSPRAYSTSRASDIESRATVGRSVINRILEPPTAERPFTRILANNTVAGGHMRADYRVTPRFVPFVAGGFFRDESFEVPTNIFFGYGGFRWRWKGGEASLNAGYRAQLNDTDGDAAARAVAAAQQNLDQAVGVQEIAEAQASLAAAQTDQLIATARDGEVFRNDAHLRFDVSFDVGGPYSLELFGDTFYVLFERIRDCQSEIDAGLNACEGIDP
ncbi:MAG: hypothetical protein AAFV29_10930, partial [Myxococcota bacterium]